VGRNRLASEPPARRVALLGGSLLTSGLFAGWLLSAASERRTAARTLEQEHRRVAADIHDLIMQDLSLALANARTLASGHADGSQTSVVVSAGERALAGARDVVGSLTSQASPRAAVGEASCPGSPRTAAGSEPIVRAIEASAQAAARSTRLVFDAAGVPGSARADGPTRAALLHVAREAVTNATKHASPNAIEVTLRYTDRWRLTVRDEGDGFDAARTDNGFGLTSMRAQAHALGGVLRVSSAADRGTTVEVILP
jgi:signal transduction histidine kinase